MEILTPLFTTIMAIVANIVASNLYDRTPGLARRIISCAVWRLRIEDRPRRSAEWLSELERYSGKLDKVHFALRCLKDSYISNDALPPRPLHATRSPLKATDSEYQIVPNRLKNLSPQTLQDVLEYLFGQDFHSIHDRDTAALAGTRIIHCNLPAFNPRTSLDGFLGIVNSRLLTPQQGGRSFALGALASLLRPSLNIPFDSTYISELETAALLAIHRRTFLNPEFGLLIAAALCERFPKRRSVRRLVDELIIQVIDDPQNVCVKHVAVQMREWLPQRNSVPLETAFNWSWLEQQVVRPLPRNTPIFLRRAEAELAVHRLDHGLLGTSAREQYLADQMIRLDASRLLQLVA